MIHRGNTRIASVIGVVLCLAATEPSFAQKVYDQVWIEPQATTSNEQVFTPRSLIRKDGEVVSIDDKTIVFTPKNETEPVQIASSRVVWIEPGFEDAASITAVETFRSGKTNPSISLLLDVVAAGPAVWRAQWLSMHLWQAAFQEQKYPAALELVNQIDARPLPPMILGGLPIQWSGERLPVAAIDAARNILATVNAADKQPKAVRLVAASWLLNEPNENVAEETLRTFSLQKERPALAQLATVLLWRKALPPEVIANRDAWDERLTKMPLTLIPGPRFLAGERYEAAGQSDHALEMYLSLALTSPRPHAVTHLAKPRAAELLKQLNRPDEAAKLMSLNEQSGSP
jgi:hypothetical protein